MRISETEWIWHDGEFIKWNDARVHVMSHVLHYGSSVFEGIRCYSTKRGPAVFRLREHMQRFLNSAKVYRMNHDWSVDDFCDAAVELVCAIEIVNAWGYFAAGPFTDGLFEQLVIG